VLTRLALSLPGDAGTGARNRGSSRALLGSGRTGKTGQPAALLRHRLRATRPHPADSASQRGAL